MAADPAPWTVSHRAGTTLASSPVALSDSGGGSGVKGAPAKPPRPCGMATPPVTPLPDPPLRASTTTVDERERQVADRTSINFWVTLDHEPGPDEIAVIRNVAQAHDPIDLDVRSASLDGGKSWNAGGFYCEGIPDEADQIADELHDAFPDAVEVRCWDDPKYEWLGTLTVYSRGEPGARTASCDANGTAVYSAAEILQVVERTRAEHEPDLAIAVMAVIEALRALEL